MKKPSARARRAAIRALELAASNRTDDIYCVSPYDICGTTGLVFRLVQSAWIVCINGGRGSATYLAEAACLLREGWSPGEPTVRIGGGK